MSPNLFGSKVNQACRELGDLDNRISFGVSVAVSLCLLVSVIVLCSLELSWGYLGAVWWYLSGIYGTYPFLSKHWFFSNQVNIGLRTIANLLFRW